jgi:hypothetical protein
LLLDAGSERLLAMRNRRMVRELIARLLRQQIWLIKMLRWILFAGLRRAAICVDLIGHAVALTLDDGPDQNLTPTY